MVADARHRVHGTISFDTRDLSAGGAFLRSDLLLEVGEELEIEFQIPGTTVAPLRARAKVVRVDQAAAMPGMGISFDGLSDPERESVRAFLAGAG